MSQLENKRKQQETSCVQAVKKTLISSSHSLLHYFSQTTDLTCPVCNKLFQNTTTAQLQTHVNSCLDADITANSSESCLDSDVIAPNPDSVKNSWSQLFNRTSLFTIRGLWSCQETDTAPGLDHDESTWFGYTIVDKKRVVPYYKWLAGTNMTVDAFSFGEIKGCEGYLLSHFHGDHYGGLNENWTHGPIYCSEITARLVELKLGVSTDFIHPLPMNEPCKISDELIVTLIDANHCPGAVVFLVQFGSFRYLHTGDFRACHQICMHPMLKEPLDIVYLDTTYLEPKYSFPSQQSCVQAACDVAKRHFVGGGIQEKKIDHWLTQEKKEIITDHNNQRLLVVVGTYSLGKENIFIEIAKSLNSKIFVTDQKRMMLNTFHDKELDSLLTDDTKEAQVHVIPLGHIEPRTLEAYYNSLKPYFTQMIAFKPTGWTYRASADPQQQKQLRSLESIIKARTPDVDASTLKPSYDTPQVKIYNIPYSEHSSFRELALFVASLDIRRIVPTVNIRSEKSREKMSLLLDKWAKDKKKLNDGVIKVIDLDYW